MIMSNTQPTEPLPPQGGTPPADRGTPPAPPGATPPGVVGEPFYKRHGLAFAISTLVLSAVILLGLFTAGAFAVANVVMHVGERAISRVVPDHGQPMPGVPQVPGKPGDGGNGGGGEQGNQDQQGHVLLRGTIASMSGDTWTIDRQSGASVTVTIDSSTAFGMPGQSASKDDFAKGDEVVVLGKRSDGSLTATRILKLDAFPTRPPSTPGSQTPGPQTPGS
ncbi:MAG: hypothetical protein JF618_09040 [Leifsonia sp.]|nr:hypothetical protein [Leifsonia sp.]